MYGMYKSSQCSSCKRNSECAGQEKLAELNQTQWVDCRDYVYKPIKITITNLPVHGNIIPKCVSCFIKKNS